MLKRTLAGFVIFCALSGVVYIINDIKDIESDRLHPRKKNRPIPSGRLPVSLAFLVVLVIGTLALAGAFLLNTAFGITALAYVIIVILYSLHLKNYVILDLLLVALGFVIRAVAGVEAITVNGYVPEITPWFIACTLFLALFIAICKRRHEITLLEEEAVNHRKVLSEYSPAFLDQMVSVTTSATIISYALWSTIGKYAEYNMIYSLPFVIYGIFRYLYLVYMKKKGGAPEVLLLKDRALQVAILLWLISIIALLYIKRPI